MATRVDFKAIVADHAKLEGQAEIALGHTGFAGDGQRLFLQWNGTGILFGDSDATAFLQAAMRTVRALGIDDQTAPEGAHG